MSEIDPVFDAIRNHIVSAEFPPAALSEPIQHTIIDGFRRFQERFFEKHRYVRDGENEVYEAGKKNFGDIGDDLKSLVDSLPSTSEEQIEAFQGLAKRALIARRGTYDLTNRERPWEELTPEEALLDEDDQYSFVIIDTLVEKLEKLGQEEEDEDTPEKDVPPMILKKSRRINVEDQSVQYLHCTPLEAVALSKSGKALGYDLLRWGEKWHEEGFDDGFLVAIASSGGIRYHPVTQREKDWIEDVDRADLDRNGIAAARRRYIEARNFFPWGTLTRFNKDFILSLLWVPEEPMSPLEALAAQASDD